MGYATLDDLIDFGLPPAALESLDPGTQERILAAASSEVDSYLRDRYHLPLSAPFDPLLSQLTVQIAAWKIMVRRGFSPNSPADTAIRIGYEDAIKLLTRVANGQAQIDVNETSPDAEEPIVTTSEARGWPGGGLGPGGMGL